MKIGIDARFAVDKRRGIGNYVLNLIKHLSEIDTANEYVLYIDKNDCEGILPEQSNFKIKTIYPSNYFIWEQLLLPMHAKRDAVDILHCTGNTSPINLDRRIKLVTTIHDISYMKPYSLIPKSQFMYQRLGRYYRQLVVSNSANRIDVLIAVSEFARKDILFHVPMLAEKPHFVTYEAVDSLYRAMDKNSANLLVKQKYNINGEFILNVGGRDPQKNVRFVIENIIELKRKGAVGEKVVIAGLSSFKEIYQGSNDFGSELLKDFFFIGFTEKEDLVRLYNSAKVFLFPSLYESFGLPPLESMACGTPVIASNTGAIPEITSGAAILFDPRDGQEFKSILSKILSDDNLRSELIERGYKRASQFSWGKMAHDTLEIYKNIV